MTKTLLLLPLVLLPFFVGLGDSAVWDSNEAFYVQTPREMVASGDWVVPTFNGQPRLNKPPLSYWLVAGAYQVFGFSILVERLVMALVAAGAVLLVWATGRLTLGEPAAVLAAGIFATSFRFLVLSRRLFIDVLLVLCILLALYFLARWLVRGSRRCFIAAAVALGLGCLAKGPVALLPLLPVGAWLIVSRRRQLQQAPILAAAAAGAAVAASWFVLLGLRLGWEPVWSFLVTENVGRLTHLDFGPERGPLFYLGVFAGDFFPWSFLFVAALLVRPHAGRRADGFDRLWLLWVAAYLLVFSISQNKQEYYILPAYPAAALWLAPRLQALLEFGWLRWGGATLLAAAAVVAGFLAVALTGAWGWVPALILGLGVWSLAARRPAGLVAGLALAYLAAFVLWLEPLDRFQPVPRLAARFLEISQQRGHGSRVRVGYYREATPSLRVYLDRDIEELARPEEAVALMEESTPAYLIVGETGRALLEARLGPRARVEGAERRLYTTARSLLQGLRTESSGSQPSWTRPVYLVSNQGP